MFSRYNFFKIKFFIKVNSPLPFRILKPSLFSLVFFFCLFITPNKSFGQITLRGTSSNGTLVGTNLSVNKPTGIKIGDIMLVNIATNGNNILPICSGWNTVKNNGLGTTTAYGSVLYKIVRSIDTVSSLTTYTFQLGTGATGGAAGIVCFYGVDSAAPFDVPIASLPSIAFGSSLVPTATSINTIAANACVIMFSQVAAGTCSWNTTRWKINSATSIPLTEIIDKAGVNTSVGVAYALKPTSGSTGTGVDSISLINRWGALLVSLKPCSIPISTQPVSTANICVGSSLNLSVTVSGNNMSYQWRKNGINISGANSSSYVKTNMTLADSGSYSVSISNYCGSTISSSTTVKVFSIPVITITPTYCNANGRIRLTASATPSSTYTYSWSNGGNRDTTSVLNGGIYSVTMVNSLANTCQSSASIDLNNELVINGNFNLGNTGFTSPLFGGFFRGYRYVRDSTNYQLELINAGRYGIGVQANNYNAQYFGKDHTTGSGNFMIVHGYSYISPIVWQQTIPVSPNTTYYFSAWAMGLDSLGNYANLRFSVNDSTIGLPITMLPHRQSLTASDNWQRFYAIWNSGSATSAKFSINDLQTATTGNSFGLDDISVGPLSPFINLISNPSIDSQIVCLNSNIDPILFKIGSGGSISVTGLPPGLTYNLSGINLTISGAPTSAGIFNYTIRTSGCSIQSFYGQIISQNGNISLTSTASTANQSICIGLPITDTKYTILGSGGTPVVTGLPSGLTTSFVGGVLSIKGIPTQTGVFNYTVSVVGGTCASASTVNGSITINPLPSVSISVDSCVTPGRYLLKANPSPLGSYSFLWSNGATTDTISINASGNYSVVITNTNGCKANQSISLALGLVLSSATSTSNQSVCLSGPFTNISYSAGGIIQSYSVRGLPPGITASLNAGVIQISGTPQQLGTFNYSVTLVSSLCRSVAPTTYSAAGMIVVNANPTAIVNADYCIISNKVKLTAVPSPAGTYTYLWSNGSITDITSVDIAGPVTVTVTNAAGCSVAVIYTVMKELTFNGNFNLGDTGFISVANGGLPYIYVPDSANYQLELVPPGFYGIGENANNYNAQFRGKDHTSGNGKFMIVHGLPVNEPIAWQQTVSVERNTSYYFSAWAMGLDSSNNYGSLVFSVNGNQLGSSVDLTYHSQSPNAPDNWRRFYSIWNSTNNTTAILSIKNTPSGFQGNSFGLDDISFGKINPYLTLTSSTATDTQVVCINTPIIPVTFIYGSGGAPTASGLPTGVTFSYTNNTITLSGTPTVAGTFNYTISTAGCDIKKFYGQIISQSQNLTLVSSAGTNTQTVCITKNITSIIYAAVSGISGVSIIGLPSGVSYSFANGFVTISGTPIVAGTFPYTISLTGGGCSTIISYSGTITVNNKPTVTITTDYCAVPGKIRLKAVPSPTGTYTYLWSNGKTTDTTSVTASGTYSVTVSTTSSCQTQASINVVLGLLLTSDPSSRTQTICLGKSATVITYAAGSNITGATVSNLPTGITYSFAGGVLTISGTPTQVGTFNYSVSTTVSCATASSTTGNITVVALPTATISADYCQIQGKVKLKVVPSPAAAYTYLWSNGSAFDSTLADVAGVYSVKVTNSNGCFVTVSLPVGLELCINGNFSQGNYGFITPQYLNQQYTFVVDSPGVQNEISLPGNYGVDTNANNYNADYYGHDHTTRSGKFMFAQGFPLIQPIAWQQDISVAPNTNYYFSAWAMGLDSLDNNAIMRFSVNGSQMGSDLTLSNHNQSQSAPDNWSRFYYVWNSGSSTTASFSIKDFRNFSAGNSFGLDDISVGSLSPFIYLASNPSTDTQTVCQNNPIDTVVLYIGSGNSGTISVSGLPAGVSYLFNGYKLLIRGAPTSLGTFNYSVTTSGCNIRTFYGQINSQGQTLILTSAPNSNNQIVCIGNAISTISYSSGRSIAPANVTLTGLPSGVSYNIVSGIINITGTPAQPGTYNYTITVTGGFCSGTSTTVNTSGIITVVALPSVVISSNYCVVPNRVRLTAIPSPSGTYQYTWSNGAITDTTTVDLIGTYSVVVTNAYGCRATDTIPISVELVTNGNFNQGNTGFICPPLGNQRYVYVADSANYQQELLFYGRYGIGTSANNYLQIYYGKDHTSGNGKFMIVHGYAFAAPVVWQETVTVNPNSAYYFSAWAMSLNDLGTNAKLKFTINDSAIGNVLTPPNHGSSLTAPDNWTRFYGNWNSGASTTAVLKITNLQTSLLGNSFGLDDISFSSLSSFISLVSPASTDTQTVCINSPIVPVSLIVGSGGSPVINGLPPGVNYTYDGYNLQLSGSPTVIGVFNYTIQTSVGCIPRIFNGQIISQGRTLTLSSASATANQTICLRNPINNITFSTSGNVTGVSAVGLPSGINTSFNSGIFTISGTPTQFGTFNYTITASGLNCTSPIFNGTVIVNSIPTVSIVSGSGGTILTCPSNSISLTATGGGTYSWSNGLGTNATVIVTLTGTYRVVVTSTSGCKDSTSVIITQGWTPGNSTWLGNTSDWSVSSNWCPSIPTLTTNAIIPAGTPNNPRIFNGIAVANNITIQSGAVLLIDGQTLQLAGNITNNGILNSENGKIELIGSTSSQIIYGSNFQNKTIKNLKLSNSSGISLGGTNDTLKVTGDLSFGKSNVVFNTNGNLVMRSTLSGTASVANMNLDNTTVLSGNRILGNVIVERYISLHSKAWQLLSTPTIGQTVNQAWQEGGSPMSNNSPGYGTAITSNVSNATSLGFDFISPGGPGIKSYNSILNTYNPIANTSVAISNVNGYMVYVRGDRSVTTTSQPSTATTLRTKGALRTPLDNPPAVISVAANKFESVGNPYASAIDFSNVSLSGGMQQVFYLWDPKLTTVGVNSAYGLGGFQTFVKNVNSPGYIVTPGGGSYLNGNTNIESGSAFFVHTVNTLGSIAFSENSKVSGSNMVFRPSASIQQMKVNFHVQYNNQKILLDGVLSEFDNTLSDSVDVLDAFKIGNMSGENISINKGDIDLVVERSSLIDINDTIHYRFGKLREQTYELEFVPNNFRQTGITAFLIDNVLNTSTRISLTDTTRITFTVSPGDIIKSTMRFYMVFKHGMGSSNSNIPITKAMPGLKRKYEY